MHVESFQNVCEQSELYCWRVHEDNYVTVLSKNLTACSYQMSTNLYLSSHHFYIFFLLDWFFYIFKFIYFGELLKIEP